MSVARSSPMLLLVLSALCANADELAEVVTETSPEAELIALETILHEDFLATFASGRTIDRATFIDRILGNRPAPFAVTHESIRVHGDTALVIDVAENGRTKFTWIAVKHDGQWRVISETFSRIEST